MTEISNHGGQTDRNQSDEVSMTSTVDSMNGMSLAMSALRQRGAQAIELAQPINVDQVPTPALILNRQKFDANIEKMAQHMATHGKGFRPHAKTHKCPLIAQHQLQAGAVGVCVAKLSEGLALAYAGIQQILVTSPVTTATKAVALIELLQRASQVQVVVDSEHGLALLAEVLSQHQLEHTLGVLVDIDVAMGRTGNRDLPTIVRLAQQITAHAGMRFDGVQHYAGHLMHLPEYAQRKEKSLSLWQRVTEIIDHLSQQGFSCDVVTGGGTGTFDIDVEVGALTDMQVGSYIFMDEEYRQIAGLQSTRFDDFASSLTVACTTISEPTSKTMTVDGGYKAFASDSVDPVCDDLPEFRFKFAGDEHGVLIRPDNDQHLQLGQVIQFVVPHCDPTVNLHEYYWVQERDGMIHSVWPITARGCSW